MNLSSPPPIGPPSLPYFEPLSMNISEQGPQGPGMFICQKLSSFPLWIRFSGTPMTFFQILYASSSSL